MVPFFFSEVWHFPSDNEPADLNSDDPNPASWDPERLLTWFPFDTWISMGVSKNGGTPFFSNIQRNTYFRKLGDVEITKGPIGKVFSYCK